jgi:hypothetical protein
MFQLAELIAITKEIVQSKHGNVLQRENSKEKYVSLLHKTNKNMLIDGLLNELCTENENEERIVDEKQH